MRPFLLVGLTGSIATGKSTVSRMFAHLGARVIDADLLSREVVMPGQPAYARIVEEFGRQVVQEDGSLDRKALGAIVFADPARRKRVALLFDYAQYLVPAGDIDSLARGQGTNLVRRELGLAGGAPADLGRREPSLEMLAALEARA